MQQRMRTLSFENLQQYEGWLHCLKVEETGSLLFWVMYHVFPLGLRTCLSWLNLRTSSYNLVIQQSQTKRTEEMSASNAADTELILSQIEDKARFNAEWPGKIFSCLVLLQTCLAFKLKPHTRQILGEKG